MENSTMSTLSDIAVEIERILSCSYVPSLKKLHDISVEAETCDINDWALANACKVDGLADVILNGIELFPYALELLTRFARCRALGDAFLKQRPSLLDTLLRKALGSETDFRKYGPAGVAILSSPSQILLPAIFAQFLSRLIQDVNRQLSFCTIEPIYQIISALGAGHVDHLPAQVLHHLQETLINALKNLDVQDCSTDLSSLAVLAHLASHAKGLRSTWNASDTQGEVLDFREAGIEGNPALSLAGDFFGSKKLQKILDFTVLKAILASSSSSNLTVAQNRHSLNLCTDIVKAIVGEERSSWCSRNTGKLRKLCDRILRQDIDGLVQATASNFLLALTGHGRIPVNVCDKISEILIGRFDCNSVIDFYERALAHLETEAFHNIFLHLLRVACGGCISGVADLWRLKSANSLSEIFIKKSQWLSKFGDTILSVIQNEEGYRLISELMDMREKPVVPASDLPLCICPCAMQGLQRRLRSTLRLIIMTSALGAVASGRDILRNAVHLMPELRTGEAEPCHHKKSYRGFQRPLAVSSIEARNDPPVASPSRDWRKRLLEDVSRNALNQSESIVKLIGEVCRDLEARCNDVEAPLRKEQAVSEDLRSQLADAESHLRELDAEIRSKATKLEEVEIEKHGLSQQNSETMDALREKATCIDKLEEQIQQIKDENRLEAEALVESARQQDLAYLAILTGKDERYEEQAVNLANTEEKLRTLEEDLARSRLQGKEFDQRLHDNGDTIENQKKAMKELHDALCATTETKEDLIRAEESLVADKTRLEDRLMETMQEREAAIAQNIELLQAAESAKMELVRQSSNAISEKEASLQAMRAEQQEKMEAMIEKHNALQISADDKVKQHERTIAKQRVELDSLRVEQEARAREFAEAQDLSRRLMAIVGIKRSSPLPHSTTNEDVSNTRDHELIQNPDPQPLHQVPMVADGKDIQARVRTSKSRIQASRLSPREHQDGQPSVKRKKQVAARSTPLGQSVNSVNRTVPSKRLSTPSPEKPPIGKRALIYKDENDVGHAGESDESFEGSDLFTSTDHRRLLKSESGTLRESWDETTADL